MEANEHSPCIAESNDMGSASELHLSDSVHQETQFGTFLQYKLRSFLSQGYPLYILLIQSLPLLSLLDTPQKPLPRLEFDVRIPVSANPSTTPFHHPHFGLTMLLSLLS